MCVEDSTISDVLSSLSSPSLLSLSLANPSSLHHSCGSGEDLPLNRQRDSTPTVKESDDEDNDDHLHCHSSSTKVSSTEPEEGELSRENGQESRTRLKKNKGLGSEEEFKKGTTTTLPVANKFCNDGSFLAMVSAEVLGKWK